MTQDEMIEMARQADIRDSLEYDHMECDIESLEAFANLVAQHEREACAEVCKKHADVYALLEQNPHASGAGKLAWAACIDNRDTILARGQA
jgi:hypothetical protein